MARPHVIEIDAVTVVPYANPVDYSLFRTYGTRELYLKDLRLAL